MTSANNLNIPSNIAVNPNLNVNANVNPNPNAASATPYNQPSPNAHNQQLNYIQQPNLALAHHHQQVQPAGNSFAYSTTYPSTVPLLPGTIVDDASAAVAATNVSFPSASDAYAWSDTTMLAASSHPLPAKQAALHSHMLGTPSGSPPPSNMPHGSPPTSHVSLPSPSVPVPSPEQHPHTPQLPSQHISYGAQAQAMHPQHQQQHALRDMNSLISTNTNNGNPSASNEMLVSNTSRLLANNSTGNSPMHDASISLHAPMGNSFHSALPVSLSETDARLQDLALRTRPSSGISGISGISAGAAGSTSPPYDGVTPFMRNNPLDILSVKAASEPINIAAPTPIPVPSTSAGRPLSNPIPIAMKPAARPRSTRSRRKSQSPGTPCVPVHLRNPKKGRDRVFRKCQYCNHDNHIRRSNCDSCKQPLPAGKRRRDGTLHYANAKNTPATGTGNSNNQSNSASSSAAKQAQNNNTHTYSHSLTHAQQPTDGTGPVPTVTKLHIDLQGATPFLQGGASLLDGQQQNSPNTTPPPSGAT